MRSSFPSFIDEKVVKISDRLQAVEGQMIDY
jgi:hypothetical protein